MKRRRLLYKRGRLAEDPRGLRVEWRTGALEVHHSVAIVVGVYYRETPPGFMLYTKRLDGTPGPDVSAGAVEVLEEENEDA